METRARKKREKERATDFSKGQRIADSEAEGAQKYNRREKIVVESFLTLF